MADSQTPTEAALLSTSPPSTTFDASSQINVNGLQPNGSESEEDVKPLFDPSFISAEVSAQLPEGYSIRPLRRTDYHIGPPTTNNP
jgi:hypothetical protein